MLLSGTLILAGCGANSNVSVEPDSTSASLDIGAALSDSPGFLHDPEIDLIVRPGGAPLTVAYSAAALQQTVAADYVAAEWEYMRGCLAVSAEPPVVLVVDGWLASVDSDDVLFSFEGRRLASSSLRSTRTNLIRISTFDFDGSQGNPGFHLRSILGRYLWSLNKLPSSGYNTRCASRA